MTFQDCLINAAKNSNTWNPIKQLKWLYWIIRATWTLFKG